MQGVSSSTMTEHPLSNPSAGPCGIVGGPDGALWLTEIHSGRIGRLRVDGELASFPLPTPDAGPSLLVAGPDGTLWFLWGRFHSGS